MARDDSDGAETWLVDLPPTPRPTWSAIGVAVAVLVGFAGVAPFARIPLREFNALFPPLDGIVLVSSLITVTLLLTQFTFSRAWSLLALASGYLFTALIVVPHALTFASAFSRTGLPRRCNP